MHHIVTVWIDMDAHYSYCVDWCEAPYSYCVHWYGSIFKLLCGFICMHHIVTVWMDMYATSCYCVDWITVWTDIKREPYDWLVCEEGHYELRPQPYVLLKTRDWPCPHAPVNHSFLFVPWLHYTLCSSCPFGSRLYLWVCIWTPHWPFVSFDLHANLALSEYF